MSWQDLLGTFLFAQNALYRRIQLETTPPTRLPPNLNPRWDHHKGVGDGRPLFGIELRRKSANIVLFFTMLVATQ